MNLVCGSYYFSVARRARNARGPFPSNERALIAIYGGNLVAAQRSRGFLLRYARVITLDIRRFSANRTNQGAKAPRQSREILPPRESRK